MPFSERPANCDNSDIDDDIRLLVEAVQEAVLQGNASPEKCNRLRKLYEILCQDLDATDTAEICSRQRAGLVRGSLNNEPTLSKSKDSSNPFSKSAATSGFNATSKSQDCFDRRPWVGAGCVKRDGGSIQRVGFEQSSLNLNKKEFGLTQSVKNPTFDDLTYGNLELLEDESSWKSLLAQTEDLNISEEHLELVRRLLLEAAKKGVGDENLADVVSEAYHNTRIESESEQLMPKHNSGIGRNPQQNLHNENVEIPFLTKKEQRWENQTFHSVVYCQRDPRQRAERTHTLLRTAQPHFNEPSGVDSLKSGINDEKCLPETVSDEVTAAEIVKQESLMSRILDELPLLDTLVAIQIEMCIANISESLHASETLSIESNQAFGHGSCLLAAESYASDAEPGFLVGGKMPGDAYDAPSAVSKSSCLNTASAIIGSDMQDSCSSKNSRNNKQFDGNKVSIFWVNCVLIAIAIRQGIRKLGVG